MVKRTKSQTQQKSADRKLIRKRGGAIVPSSPVDKSQSILTDNTRSRFSTPIASREASDRTAAIGGKR